VFNKTNSFKILIVKPEGNKPIGKPSHRWEDNINGFKKKGWRGLDLCGSG